MQKGGGDSTALLHLCLSAGVKVEAVTVDHRLRPESAGEAAGVAAACAALGVPHVVQVWDHGPVAGNLMDAARRARMALILDWARGRELAHVALGHTRDDQAETLLMGLARGAGIAGLCGMRRAWDAGEVTLHRPLLDAGRAELRDWLKASGVTWVEDPTNEDARFTRVKARRALAVLGPMGITLEGLASVAGHLAQAQAALGVQVQSALQECVEPTAGALRVKPGLWDTPPEVQRQAIAAGLLWLNRADYPPRAAELERLLATMIAGRDATLAGCRFRQGWLMREVRALGGPVPVGGLWDGRWRVSGPAGEVRALGAEGLRQGKAWREVGLPRAVLEVTPAVWQGEALVSAPFAGWSAGWTADLDQSVHLFGLSD
jgi:tRNA(Ile)-lysidine synthase